MNKSVTILWGLSIGVAFVLGALSQNYNSKNLEQKNVGNISLTVKKESTRQADTAKAKSTNEQGSDYTFIDATPVKKTQAADIAKQLEKVLSGGYLSANYESIAQAYLLVENLSEKELINVFNELTTSQHNDRKINIISLILSRLSLSNPVEALALIESSDLSVQSNTIAMSAIIASWAKTEPLSTFDWYMNNNNSTFEGMTKTSSLASIFYGLANKDKVAAFDKLIELSNDYEQTMAITGLSLTLETAKEYETFLSYSSELDDKSVKQKLLRTWGRKNPKEAISWTEQLENLEEKYSSQQAIYSSWSYSSPREAADWFINTANDDDRKSALVSKVIDSWATHNPNSAMEWLEMQPNINAEKHKAELLAQSVYANTEFAIEHLPSLSNEKNKLELSSNIYRHLIRNNDDNAENFLSSSEYKEELKKVGQDYIDYLNEKDIH